MILTRKTKKTPTARTTMTSFFDTTTNLWLDAFLAGRVVVFNNDDNGNNNGRGEGLLMTTTATSTTTKTLARTTTTTTKDTILRMGDGILGWKEMVG